MPLPPAFRPIAPRPAPRAAEPSPAAHLLAQRIAAVKEPARLDAVTTRLVASAHASAQDYNIAARAAARLRAAVRAEQRALHASVAQLHGSDDATAAARTSLANLLVGLEACVLEPTLAKLDESLAEAARRRIAAKPARWMETNHLIFRPTRALDDALVAVQARFVTGPSMGFLVRAAVTSFPPRGIEELRAVAETRLRPRAEARANPNPSRSLALSRRAIAQLAAEYRSAAERGVRVTTNALLCDSVERFLRLPANEQLAHLQREAGLGFGDARWQLRSDALGRR